MRPIRVLLLDVGGVIVPSVDPAVVVHCEDQLGLARGELMPFLFEWDPWYALSTGKSDEQQYWQALADSIHLKPAALRQLLLPVMKPSVVDRAVVELARAARMRVRVAVLSNATITLEAQLHSLGVAGLFDPIINSARIGLRKPDPRVFTYAIQAVGVPAESILFVDDKERNTVAAEAHGIRSIRFESAKQLAEALIADGIIPGETLPVTPS